MRLIRRLAPWLIASAALLYFDHRHTRMANDVGHYVDARFAELADEAA